MEMAVELAFRFDDKSKETELVTLLKNMSFEPVADKKVADENEFQEKLLEIFPSRQRQIDTFMQPDNCGNRVYSSILSGIEYVELRENKCVISSCGDGNSNEATQRFMKFVHSVGGKPLACRVQGDEVGMLAKYTMNKRGKISEEILDSDADF